MPQSSEDPELGAPGPRVDESCLRRRSLGRLQLSHVFGLLGPSRLSLLGGDDRAMDAAETARQARCPRCHTVFAICSHCDRGQVYCGESCSRPARRDSLRRARRRHRRSPEGRLDHRDRERDRRRRRRLECARVGDHPSAQPAPGARVLATASELSTVEPVSDQGGKPEVHDVCSIPSDPDKTPGLRCIGCARVCPRLRRGFFRRLPLRTSARVYA